MKQKLRVIVTTDMEVDDMNSTIHLALYLNRIDLEAIVYTASQYHFQGDGIHTLGDVNPHWRTKGVRSYECQVVPPEPDPDAGRLSQYRPFPTGWIEQLWTNEYAQAFPTLQANARMAGEPPFPTPEDLVARTFVGNVAFEGDVREDTPGSDVIKQAILDDDPRPLWLLSWGGMNTIVRALMSIAEDHMNTAAWEDVRKHVYSKVRVMGVMDGVGQDNSWLDHGSKLFPELVFWRVPFAYGGYVDAKCAQPDSVALFQAPWPEQQLVKDNGPLMERYMLYGDGKVYENEPERFQFGKHATLDWGWPGMEPLRFEHGDFMAEGDSMTYIPLLDFGLRGADDPRFNTLLGPMFHDGESPVDGAVSLNLDSLGAPATHNINPFLRSYQEDFAARAQWCTHDPQTCNHPPRILEVSNDLSAAPGTAVSLAARATDPDGDPLSCSWSIDRLVSIYNGRHDVSAWSSEGEIASFTVPDDAIAGDRLVLTFTVRDHAARPMTRYAQVAVEVR